MEMQRHMASTPASITWSQACVLVLMAAMTTALVAGLLAWGPVPFRPAQHAAMPATASATRQVMLALEALPLLLFCGVGWYALRRTEWPGHLARPWSWFFASMAASDTICCVGSPKLAMTACVMAHGVMSASFLFLALGLLAERVDARFGSVWACTAAAVAAGFAMSAWWIGAVQDGAGDLRALLLLELLPLLVVPAGALNLDGQHTSNSDWLLMLAVYALTRWCGLADAAIVSATGGLNGQTLTLLGSTAIAGWLMVRCVAAARAISQRAERSQSNAAPR
jgi:hypothetical protein